MLISGWGRLHSDGPNSDVLLKEAVALVPRNKCKKMYARCCPGPYCTECTLAKGKIGGNMICAASSGKGGTCQDDSGSTYSYG